MLSPFPGMNPYLENPELWPDVHSRLIVTIADSISSFIDPKYWVAIEKRTYLSQTEDSVLVGIPDLAVIKTKVGNPQNAANGTLTLALESEAVQVQVPIPQWIRENYLEIRDLDRGSVVTVIEILSPTNKCQGKGRDAYEEKRMEVLASPTNLVEIDLLRGGEPMAIASNFAQTDYRILISRSSQRPHAQLYAFSIRDRIPKFTIPLKREDSEPIIDLQNLLHGLEERARYNLIIDYTREPIPSLKPEDKQWAELLLRNKAWR